MFNRATCVEESITTGPWEKAYVGGRSGTICMQPRSADFDMGDLARIYAQAFSGAPWFESWTAAEADSELRGLAARGADFVISICAESGKTLGFGAGMPLKESSSVDSFVSRGSVALAGASRVYYVAELCTSAKARNRGICSDVLAGLLEVARDSGFERAITRTRSDNSGMIRIFQRSGFNEIDQYRTTTGGVASDRTVFARSLG